MRYIVLICAVFVSGCAIIKRTPVELVPSRTNIVQVITTNVITREVWTTNRVEVSPQRTNEVGQVLPAIIQLSPMRELLSYQAVQTNLTPIILPAVWVTNLSLSNSTETAIRTAGDLAPVPWGGLAGQAITGLAGIAFGVVNLIAKRKALKAAGEAQENAKDFRNSTEILVHNVEQIRKEALKVPGYTKSIDDKVMSGIQLVQQAANVAHIIAPIVEEKTGYTKQEAADERNSVV